MAQFSGQLTLSSDYKMAKGPENCIYKILFIEPCRKQNQTKDLSFTRAVQSTALTYVNPHKFLLILSKLYRQLVLWNSLFMCIHFQTYLALGESLKKQWTLYRTGNGQGPHQVHLTEKTTNEVIKADAQAKTRTKALSTQVDAWQVVVL